MSASDSDAEQFELVDASSLAKEIVEETKPDLDKIKAWLCPTEHDATSSEYRRHLSSQAPGTGHWIRETQQFKQWHESSEHGSLWIKAAPGAGKSVVAASLVDSLLRQENVPVLYFFFRQIIETNRSFRFLIRNFLAQALLHSEILQVSLWEIVEDKQDIATVSNEQLWKLLVQALKHTEKAYVVVDALDEADYDESFFDRLDTLGAVSPDRIKVLMTSRPKEYLQRAMKNPQVIHVSLEEELVNRDIAVYVRRRVKLCTIPSLTNAARDIIQQTICRRCHGLFLYARLMLDQVLRAVDEEQRTESQILTMAEQLPAGLEQMYDTMLRDHATSSGVDQAMQMLILQFVTHSARPLRLLELSKAVEASNCPNPVGLNSKDVVRLGCGPLLEVMEDGVVQILHHSFTEFLLDNSRAQREATQFPVVDPRLAHREIALTCLNRLYDSSFKDYEPETNNKIVFRRASSSFYPKSYLQYPLLHYAAQSWTYHVRHCDLSGADLSIVATFCSIDNPCYHAWIFHDRHFGSRRRPASFDVSKLTHLHIAARYGLLSWAKQLIASKVDVDALDNTGNSPLIYAVQSSHTEIVNELLNAGANPDIAGSIGIKPLHEAASANAFQTVKLLVEAGVSPTTPKMRKNGRIGYGRFTGGANPLMLACEKGHAESVLEMLPKVSNPDDLESAVCYAAENGNHEVLVALLNNTNVSVNAKLKAELDPQVDAREGYQTALMLAVRALSPACVRTLLERGADVHLPSHVEVKISRLKGSFYDGGAHPQPIHGLSATEITTPEVKTFNEILDLLLGAGASLEDRDPVTQATPFLCANCRSSFPPRKRLGSRATQESGTDTELLVPMILAAAGADINAINRDGENLLHRYFGSFRTSLSGLEGLLQMGVNSRIARYSDGATPLHCVLRRGDCKVESVDLLAKYGADVNAMDRDGIAPLHLASSSAKYVTTIEALVERGANINATNRLGKTALHIMRLEPSTVIDAGKPLRFLLEAGADPAVYDHSGRTPFLAALEAGDITFVDELLKHTRVNIHDHVEGRTALHLACALKREPVKVVEKLVDHGCDPMVVDWQGNTLLHEAARCQRYPGDITLAESLISLGVRAHATNNVGRKAIHIISSSRDNEGFTAPIRAPCMAEILVENDLEPDINVRDNSGWTPLHIAASISEAQTFCLLKAGADLLAPSHDGRTALHFAAGSQQINTVAMLLDFARETGVLKDALHRGDEIGRTPLWHACGSGRPESVRMLLDAGADPQIADIYGLPPLLGCVECYKNQRQEAFISQQSAAEGLLPADEDLVYGACRVEKTVDMMVAAGAEVSFALRAAARTRLPEHNDSEIVLRERSTSEGGCAEDVLEQASVSHHVWGTTLNSWVAHGMTDKVAEVIKNKGLPSAPEVPIDNTIYGSNHSGKPLLQIACERSTWNLDMIKLIVEAGSVDVNGRRHHRISDGSQAVSTDTTSGETALHVLAAGKYYWNVEAIRYLVEHGAEIDALNKSSHTPLDIACDARNYCSWVSHGLFRPRCAETLLQLGADPNLVDRNGLVTLNKARRDIEIVRLLLQHGANVNKAQRSLIVTAVECANVSLLQLYLERGGDPSVADSSEARGLASMPRSDHWYPLLIAAMPTSNKPWDADTATGMIQLLLEYGARVDSPVHNQHTLIHYLFERTTTTWLRAFVDCPNIDMNTRDQSGRTVFLAACSCAALLEKAADLFAYRSSEDRALQMASYQPSHLALAESPIHGPRIDYLATSNDGSHLWHHGIQGSMSLKPEFARPLLLIPGVRELIRQRNEAGFLPLHLALANPAVSLEMCELLIADSPANLLEADPNGDSALHHLVRRASWTSHSSLAERYQALGGDINARNDLGESPLHLLPFATLWKPDYTERVTDPLNFLIEHGVDVQAITNDGSTILHILARQAKTGTATGERAERPAQVFKRLVQLGCDPLTEDAVGRSALDMAAECGGKSILELYQRRKTGDDGAT